MIPYALFSGCKIPYFLPHYESSTRAVLNVFNIGLVDIEFNCCGYPARDIDFMSYILLSARNFALAEQHGVNLITPCKCCLGNMKQARNFLLSDDSLKKHINAMLKNEGLVFEGSAQIKHLLSFLDQDLGVEAIKSHIRHRFKNLKLAVSYGCHALRPSNIMAFDNPFEPSIFERLVMVSGATPVKWSKRLECCGRPIFERDKILSGQFRQAKIQSAQQAGADFICTACTYCQLQFESKGQTDGVVLSSQNPISGLNSVLYTQVLGLSLGIDDKTLGLIKHPDKPDIRGFL